MLERQLYKIIIKEWSVSFSKRTVPSEAKLVLLGVCLGIVAVKSALKKGAANGGEGMTVLRAGPVLGNSGTVQFCTVAFMLGKAIVRKLAV